METIKKILHALFFFPGTFLHELLHLIPALIITTMMMMINAIRARFGFPALSHLRVTSFNVIPDIKSGRYGSVSYVGANFLSVILISAGPKLAWVLLSLFLLRTGIIDATITPNDTLTFILHYDRLSAIETVLFFYIGIQLFWAGSLSRKDWSNILGSITKAAIIIAIIIITLIFTIEHLRLHDSPQFVYLTTKTSAMIADTVTHLFR